METKDGKPLRTKPTPFDVTCVTTYGPNHVFCNFDPFLFDFRELNSKTSSPPLIPFLFITL
jgi:hypothetical protein